MKRNLLLTGILLLGMNPFGAKSKPVAPEPADPAWGAPLPWSKFAEVYTRPGLQGISLLNDGNPGTSGIWCTGAEGAGEVTVQFPRPMAVTLFRFIQAGATKYRLSADLTGKHAYQIIKELTVGKTAKTFISIPVDQKVYALKLTALAGKARYRSPFPRLSEIEIYSKDKPPAASSPVKADKALQVGAKEPLPAFKRKEIDIRLCIDAWHAGIPRKKPAGNLEQSKTFQSMLKRFKEADANSARFFIETACCDNEMPWKSEKLWPGHGYNQLTPLVTALHKHHIKVYFFSHAWISPFQKRGKRAKMPYCRWDYPYEQSDRLVGIMKQYTMTYPCVICDNGFHDKWLEFLKEAIEHGVDGVYLTPDEYYFKGHNLSRANCPLCTAEFKKMYGYDSMPKSGALSSKKIGATVAITRGKVKDSEKYRKWKLFEYNKIADLFHDVSAKLKKVKPSAQIVMSDNKVTEDFSGRLEHNICLDIMENNPNADFAQVYGTTKLLPVGRISAYTRRIAAAAGSKDKLLASIQWLGVWDSKPEYPIQLFGYALPQIMLGARVYENYRLNYMYDTGWWPNAIECHKMIRLLEQWNIHESDTPDVACLLLSRASEDWWRTKLEGMCGKQNDNDVSFNLLYAGDDINKAATKNAGSERDRVLKMDALRGVGSKQAMESFLCENGIPYKVAFTDRMDNLKDLKRFKLLIMPFSYSLSKNALKKITGAVHAGTRLIIFNQLAPVDEFGNPYKQPLLKKLLKNKNVIYVKDNLAAVGNSAVKRAEYLKKIGGIIAPCRYRFTPNGAPIECIVNNLPEQKGFLVYLGNWSKQDKIARPVLSLPFEDAQYKAEAYSSKTHTLNSLVMNGKTGTFNGKSVKSFSIDLAPAEVKLLRIRKCPR